MSKISEKTTLGLDALFKVNLRDAIGRSGLRSNRAVARKASMSPAQLHSILNDEKRQGIGAHSLVSLSAALETDPNTLLGQSENGRPSFNAMIAAIDAQSRALSSLDWAMEYFDVYLLPKPDATRLGIYRLGKSSLAVETTGISVRVFFQEAMNTFTNSEARKRVISDYAAMNDQDISISYQNVRVPKLGRMRKDVNIRTQRLLLRCHDENGQKLVASYSLRI